MAELPVIKIKTPAKINLCLKVIGRRSDGYHNIETLFQAIDLYDELHFSPLDSDIILSTDCPELDPGEKNLIHRAAKKLMAFVSCQGGVRIHLIKRIPIGAGLGGGSSDAAATLKGLIQLYGLSLSDKDMHNIASTLGADVPFFLNGPAAFGAGTGILLEPAPPLPPFWVVLAKPNFSISTAWVYEEYDSRLTKTANKIKILKSAFNSADPAKIGQALFNDLESVCFDKFPVLKGIKRELLSLGASGALMTGSGSSVFGLFSDSESAERAFRSIKRSGGNEKEVYLCRTILK